MPFTLGNEDLTVQYKVMDNLHQAFLILSSAGMSA
jgi:CHRD domain